MNAVSAHDDEDRRRMAVVGYALVVLLVPVVLILAFYGLRWLVHHHPVAANAAGLSLMSIAILGLIWWYSR